VHTHILQEVKQLLKLYADVLDPRGLFQPDIDAAVVVATLCVKTVSVPFFSSLHVAYSCSF
jgi:hypothetical protein